MYSLFKFLIVLALVVAGVAVIIKGGQEEKNRKVRESEQRRRNRERTQAMSKQWDEIVANLMSHPSSQQYLTDAIEFLECNRDYVKDGYRMALDLVALSDGSTQNKVFALKVGRLHYSQHREGGSPTVYDEAAIANDIKARC